VAESLASDPEVTSELASRVRAFLAELHVPSLRQIDVDTERDALVLKGRVRSFHERQLAVACCRRVAGVRQIDDRLQVLQFS
jgi:osmotically-inducible protein OsmY